MATTDPVLCYRAVQARDARFDGVFYTAVRTTGIYCRPSCPAVTPKRGNVTFYPTAAAAHEAGFRACRRCRPDTTPGSPEWNVRRDTVGRAMCLIRDGVVETAGVRGLAQRLGYTERHVNRLLHAELGAGPLALARSERARTARILIETTDLAFTDAAFASGFASIRQFNDTMRQVYAMTPTQMRRTRRLVVPEAAGRLRLQLPVRQPFDADGMLRFLADHAAPGVEGVTGRTFARTMSLKHGTVSVALTLDADGVVCDLVLDDLRDTMVAVQRCRALLDLDADPVAIDSALGVDPVLGPLVAAAPGLRLPGAVDGFELAARTIVGQQVSVAGARRTCAKIAERFGSPVTGLIADAYGLTHTFPAAGALADVDPADLGMPRQRGRAVIGLARAVTAGDLDLAPGGDRDRVRTQLLGLPGIGAWTADYVLMRALADPDVYLDTDLVVRRAAAAVGADTAYATRWRPWRSYAVMHLWREARRLQALSRTDERSA